MKIYKERLY